MLSSDIIKKVVDEAMKQYAEENSGKKGIAKKDVMLIADEYGGDHNDVDMAMAEAMIIMAKNCITYLS